MSKPTFHRPIPMNSHVRLPLEWLGKPATGTVVGVASMHVIFHYIVLLDEPHQDTDFGQIRAVTVGGPQLEPTDGSTGWKFTLGSPEHKQYLEEINV